MKAITYYAGNWAFGMTNTFRYNLSDYNYSEIKSAS